jgi:hypothetical protein
VTLNYHFAIANDKIAYLTIDPCAAKPSCRGVRRGERLFVSAGRIGARPGKHRYNYRHSPAKP